MKNKKITFGTRMALLCLALATAITACKKQSFTPASEDDVVTYIKSLGFRQSDIKDMGNYYVVDGDMLFDKRVTIDASKKKIDLTKLSATRLKTEQTSTGGSVGISNVVVQIDPSMSAYQTEIQGAMNEWNSVSSGLTFTLYNGTTSPNITISDNSSLGAYVCGEALFPVNGLPGSQVYIATGYMASMSFTSAQIQYVISHELGHTIGFRHTNWYYSGESQTGTDPAGTFVGAYQIPGTPYQYGYDPDPTSIMNGGQCGNSYTSLSSYDQVAFQYLYPVGGVEPHDAFPSSYAFTLFNYAAPATINATIISVSDTQPILTVGASLYSPNGSCRLTLQTDGNLVLYRENSNGTETGIWSSRTQGHTAGALYFQTDGNLVLYAPGSSPTGTHTSLWASMLYNNSGLGTVQYAKYYLQDDQNLVMYWPTYHGGSFVYVVLAASDTQGGIVGPHPGNLNHPLWNPAFNQDYGYTFY